MKRFLNLLLLTFLFSTGMLAQDALEMKVIKDGSGDKPVMGQEVEVHRVLKDAEGTVIWSSRDVGVSHFIILGKEVENDPTAMAMDQTMLSMEKGGTYEVVMPKSLMGETAPPDLKGENIRIEVEVINFADAKPSGVELVESLQKEKGVDAAMDKFSELCLAPGEYSLHEWDINMYGYKLLEEKHLDAAVDVFQSNVKRNPDSANTYDSLGDAYLEKGEKRKARNNFEKVLAINPNFPGTAEKLAALEK
ncbi:MAG: tetratricopeptide repeat protein [Saprospirales bacterium]|nr:tetratricopeptide repeat protein [Saprospirales bacterium]